MYDVDDFVGEYDNADLQVICGYLNNSDFNAVGDKVLSDNFFEIYFLNGDEVAMADGKIRILSTGIDINVSLSEDDYRMLKKSLINFFFHKKKSDRLFDIHGYV